MTISNNNETTLIPEKDKKGIAKIVLVQTTDTSKPHWSIRIGLYKHNINIQEKRCILLLLLPKLTSPVFPKN